MEEETKKRILEVQSKKIISNEALLWKSEGQILLIQDLSWLSLILGLIS